MISVIVVTKHERKSLNACLDSIRNQSFKDFEIIVVLPKNDYPVGCDWVKEVIQSGQGIGNARNCGVAQSRGEFVVFNDDDCVAPPDWLEKIDKAFKDNPELGYLGGEITVPHNSIWQLWIDKRYHLSQSNINLGLCHGCNMAFRRELFDRFQFDEDLDFGYDETDLQNRLHSCGVKSNVFPSIVVEHNHRSNFKSFTKMRLGYAKGRVQIYKKQGRELFNWSDLLNLGFLITMLYTFYLSFFTSNLFMIVPSLILSSCFLFFALDRQVPYAYDFRIFLIDIYTSFLWTLSKLYYSLKNEVKK